MAKRFKESRRIFFPKGRQRLFLQCVSKKLNLSHYQLAALFKVSPRTLSDWKREKFSMPEDTAKKILKKSGSSLPKKIKIRDRYWYVSLGARKGGLSHYARYGCVGGNEKKRRKMWQKWWREKGRFLNKFPNQPKSFHIPSKSTKLAEFAGIMLGDGGITDYQIGITLNKVDDWAYANYVSRLLEKLFGLKVGKTMRESVVVLTISRKNLVKFCQKIGLVVGNKIRQNIDIPLWIKENKNYSLACIRGLVDTDGCVYRHRYKVGNKLYAYKKLNFSSRSKPLIKSVKILLEKINICSRIDTRGDIRLENTKDVIRYFQIIGSHNPKHINKFSGRGARVAYPSVLLRR